MPRVIYDPYLGTDTSAAVQTVLLANKNLVMANLYSFASRVFWENDPTGNMSYWSFTDADFGVSLNYLQLFASGSVQLVTLNGGGLLYRPGTTGAGSESPTPGGVMFLPRGGSALTTAGSRNDGGFKHSALNYEVGLAAQNVDITWFLDDLADYFAQFGAYPSLTNPPGTPLPMKQAMSYYRAFDDCPFWIHRVIFSPTVPVWAGCCIGCFTDGTGQIVGQPFYVGNGTTVTVPVGASQLQLGLNDVGYGDNTGSWDMNVNGSVVLVDAQSAPWSNSGGLNSAFPISAGFVAPTVVSGLTAGQSVSIFYVSGLANLHFIFFPVFDAGGMVALTGTETGAPGFYVTPTTPATPPYWPLGTTLMYRGFIRKTEAAADYLKISLSSLMQIVQDTPVPGQVIQANARSAPFVPFPQVSGTTLTPWPSAGTITRVSAKTYTVGGTGIAADQLQDCWITFNPAVSSYNFAPQNGLPPIASPGWRIQSNTASSGGSLNITFYDPPIVPGNVQQINLFSPNAETVGAPGFPSVPPPENAL